jgi:hypothetical protein
VDSIVSLINGHIAFGFLYGDLVTVVNMVADPLGDILRGRIDVEQVVDILMVERVLDDALDMGEVRNHTVGVQFVRLAIDDDNPVMPVQTLAFALVGEPEIMGGRDFDCFLDVKHNVN